jgi:hypothetical protein
MLLLLCRIVGATTLRPATLNEMLANNGVALDVEVAGVRYDFAT